MRKQIFRSASLIPKRPIIPPGILPEYHFGSGLRPPSSLLCAVIGTYKGGTKRLIQFMEPECALGQPVKRVSELVTRARVFNPEAEIQFRGSHCFTKSANAGVKGS